MSVETTIYWSKLKHFNNPFANNAKEHEDLKCWSKCRWQKYWMIPRDMQIDLIEECMSEQTTNSFKLNGFSFVNWLIVSKKSL